MPPATQAKIFDSLLRASEHVLGGSAYRGTFFLGYASSLRKLGTLTPKAAELVANASFMYLLFLRTGSEAAAELAIHHIKALQRIVRGKRFRAEALTNQRLVDDAGYAELGVFILREQGAEPALIQRAHDCAMSLQSRARTAITSADLQQAQQIISSWLATVKAGRVAGEEALLTKMERRRLNARLARAKQKFTLDLDQASEALELLIKECAGSENATALAVKLFVETVSVEHFADIAQCIAKFKETPAKLKRLGHFADDELEAAFRKMFEPEASILKGLMLEKWFWRSPAWRAQERLLMKDARAVAETLGPEYMPIIFRSPLLEAGAKFSKGFLDGAILIVRPGSAQDTWEGFIYTAIEIKAEKETRVIRQVNRDQW